MMRLLIILTMLCHTVVGQYPILVNGHKYSTPATPVVVAQFNFANTSTAGGVAGWVDCLGMPSTAVRSATDNRSGSNIGVNTISTSTTNWQPITSASNATASDVWGPTTCNGTCYFGSVTLTRGGYGTEGTNTYSAGAEHFEFTGLNPAKHYKFEVIGCRSTGNPSRRVAYVLVHNAGTTNDTLDVKDNTSKIAGPVETPTDDPSTTRFTNISPKSDGTVRLFMKRDGSDTNNTWAAYVSAVRIYQLD